MTYFLSLSSGSISFPYNSYAQDSQNDQALKEIRETADDICQTASLEHTQEGTKLTGQAKAKVSGLIGKVADLGLEGSGEYTSEHSSGVIEEHIVDAIQAGNKCKLQVFQTLEKDLIENRRPESSPTPQWSSTSESAPSSEQPAFHQLSDTVEVSLGGMTMSLPSSKVNTMPISQHPFIFNGFSPLSLRMEKNQLVVDCTTWGGPGEPPIEIHGSNFVVRPAGWDRNFNAHALEIVNKDNVPVFQFIRESDSHDLINGLFASPIGIVVANAEVTTNDPPADMIYSLLPKPIFKYPSWKYPGVYADNSN